MKRANKTNKEQINLSRDEAVIITRARLIERGLVDCSELLELATITLDCTEVSGASHYSLQCRIAPEVAMKFAGRTLAMEREIADELAKAVAGYPQAHIAAVEIMTMRS